MTRALPLTLPLAVMLAALLAPGSGHAQTAAGAACPGSVSTTTLHPVPPGAAIAVPSRAGNREETQMREAAVSVLRRGGRTVGEDAPYALSWRGGLTQDGPGRDGLSLEDIYGIPTVRDTDDVRWVQATPRLGRGGPAPRQNLMAALEVRDRSTGRVVWTAMVSCQRQERDDRALFDALAAAVLPLIGQTVSGKRF